MFESVHGCMKSPYNVMKCCSPWKLYGSSAAVIPGYGGRYTITMDGRVWAFDRSLDSSDAGSPFFEVPSQMNEDISTVELTTESGRLVQVSVSDLDVLAFGSPTELDEVLSIV